MSQLQTGNQVLAVVQPENQALGWLRQMMMIRRFEERAEMIVSEGRRSAASSTSTAARSRWRVGSIGVLREDDYVITAYRDHGHALAAG